MPLSLFLVLGTLQLFMMLQARLMTEYAAVQAVRQGSTHFGRCDPMVHTAVSLVLPTFRRTNTPGSLGAAFSDVYDSSGTDPGDRFHFRPAPDVGHDGEIVWLYRRSPRAATIRANEEDIFDLPTANVSARPVLQVSLVFWFPLKIPFANWVIARLAVAANGILDYQAQDPLMLTRKANWRAEGAPSVENAAQRAEWRRRVEAGQYTIPIIANAAIPMSSPPRLPDFQARRHCFVP